MHTGWEYKTTILGALLMAIAALGVVSWLAYLGDEACKGALISVISASTGFFLRGKVVTPDAANAGGPGSATVNVSQPSSGETTVNVPGTDKPQ